MPEVRAEGRPDNCGERCQAASSLEALNRTCYCLTLDEPALRRGLEEELNSRGLSQTMIETHPHLFSSVPLFVSRVHLEQMARVIEAVDLVVATTAFREAVLAWAPEIARYDPGCRGGLLGYDFHLSVAGPRLIEINTNPGGALLSMMQGRAQRLCCPGVATLALAPMEADAIEQEVFQIFASEWRQQCGAAALESVAIVDDAPTQQYLYPEFLLYRQLFARRGLHAAICDPGELIRRDGRLWHGSRPIDLVYNRLTDFSLDDPAHEALQRAYLAGEVVVSPHPRAHALYADKRNLALLADETFLRRTGVGDRVAAVLLESVPRTELVTTSNRDAMWAKRRQLFFKPAAGYGSKAAYRGDKLTKRVWDEMRSGIYVAQALVAPSERQVVEARSPVALKADIRNYAYAAVIKLVAARLYQGQTTNFRTPGGGFAPVFTESSWPVPNPVEA
jgi:hypothetical protein